MFPAKMMDTSPAATPTIDSSSNATVRYASVVQQHAALGAHSHRGQVRVAEPASVVSDLFGDLAGGVELAGEDVPVHQVNEHISALDNVAVDLGEQPLRAGHPAAADRRLAAGEQHQGQPEPAAHRGERVTGVEVELVGALQCLHTIVAPAEQVRRGGKLVEVVGREHVRGGIGQPVVGRQPFAAVVGLAGSDQLLDHAHRTPSG